MVLASEAKAAETPATPEMPTIQEKRQIAKLLTRYCIESKSRKGALKRLNWVQGYVRSVISEETEKAEKETEKTDEKYQAAIDIIDLEDEDDGSDKDNREDEDDKDQRKEFECLYGLSLNQNDTRRGSYCSRLREYEYSINQLQTQTLAYYPKARGNERRRRQDSPFALVKKQDPTPIADLSVDGKGRLHPKMQRPTTGCRA